MAKIDDLVKAVEDETTLLDGLTVLIQGLRDQLTQVGVDQAKLDSALVAVEANKQKLAAALQANTTPTTSGASATTPASQP